MSDKEFIATICRGWLSNKFAACGEGTPKRAFEIAKELLRLTKEDREIKQDD